MTRVQTREGEEIWETTTPGMVWVATTDDRGKERQIGTGGRIGSRLRIKTLDREITQENIIDADADPFRNGLLRRIDADQNQDEATASDQALSPDQLVKIFAKSGAAYQNAVDKLNEINVRRMRQMAEDLEVSVSQLAYLNEVIEAKYRRHGDTRTYREMMGIKEAS